MERHVDLEGCHNFRDLGGYPTRDGRQLRWRVLFRSDALHHLTPADVARLRGEIGLGDVVDLRSSGEIAIDGRGRLAAEDVRIHHLPLFDGEGTVSADLGARITLCDRYFLMTEHAKRPIARVIQTLAEAEGPAVYHCAAGKDRTGVISAVLLGLLGVADELIVADYAATRKNLDAIVARLMAERGLPEHAGEPAARHAARRARDDDLAARARAREVRLDARLRERDRRPRPGGLPPRTPVQWLSGETGSLTRKRLPRPSSESTWISPRWLRTMW